MTSATTIYSVASRTLSAVEAALVGAATPVDRAAVYPAAIPWDECECGTLAVAVQRQYPTSNFPAPDEAEQLPCGGGFLAADLIVQVLRCAPSTDGGRSLAPSVDALQETAQLILSDAWVALSTVLCLLPDLVEEDLIVQYVVRPQVFAGPAGACVGSVLGFTVAVEHSN